MNVTIYSTPTCTYCKSAKQFFQEHNVAFTDVDVAADMAEARKIVEKTGQMGVPVITIEKDGTEEIVLGFDKERLTQLLGISA